MRFILREKTPYLVSGGRAFPVEITEQKEVKIDTENGTISDEVGYLTLEEVIAKVGYYKKPAEESQEEKKSRKKTSLA